MQLRHLLLLLVRLLLLVLRGQETRKIIYVVGIAAAKLNCIVQEVVRCTVIHRRVVLLPHLAPL